MQTRRTINPQVIVAATRFLSVFFIVSVVAACNGTSTDTESVTVEGDVAVAYVKRPVATLGNPTDAITFTAGGDLFIREKSSPSAPEINITSGETQGEGDVSDPEVSYDGSKLLFSMRRNATENWSVWEYDVARGSLTQIPCTTGGTTPPGDDVDPAYLPDGRIVFVSNRQEKSRQLMTQQGLTAFAYLDEYERERTTTLHVMDGDGRNCRQISVNQSHDRNPTVLQSGEIMYSRWDHVGERNQFSIFFTNPDGTNLFVFYGAHSPGNSYLHPRELPNGQVISTLMPLSGTNEGGALMQIDIRNFSENCEPGPGVARGCRGQSQPTARTINFGMGISRYGRFSTPYPLWDGTNRALVAWSPSCAAVNVAKCPTVLNPLTGEREAEESTPVYGIYMLNLGDKTMRPVVTAPAGQAVLDPVAIQARPVPNQISDKVLDSTLSAKTSQLGTTGVGVLNVKSVYDTDSQGRMGAAVLVSGESIPMLAGIPDIARLKDPLLTRAEDRPARFIRITKAVPTQRGISRAAIGETEFEMQQILGYAEVEPDGSFKIEVPADVPIAITALDKDGRGFTPHTSWIQVRPGETRTCNGCHSPRRGNAINAVPIAGTHPNTLANMRPADPGESMAETRTRLYPSVLQLKADLEYQDVWTDTPNTGATTGTSITIRYTGNPSAADDLTTAAPATTGPNRGIIDYPTHIQPLWDKARTNPAGGTYACITCHNNPDPSTPSSAGLDLRSGTSGSGRFVSYDELLIGDPILDGNGQPVIDVVDNELVVRREEAQVISGESRASHLTEVLFNQELRSARSLGTTNHGTMLNRAEKRLVAEWIDLGAQYYNSARDSSGALRGVTGLSESVFNTTVHPILLNRCASCHQAVGQPGTGGGTGFVGRRFVLTGQAEGDFNVTLSMVGDVSTPATSELLRRPASDGISPAHGQAVGGGPVMPAVGDPDYNAICNWIRAGC